jgi:hypothetical protein
MKFKFRKPFSTFNTERNYYRNTTLKQRWVDALHDPGYLLLWGCAISLLFYILSMYL